MKEAHRKNPHFEVDPRRDRDSFTVLHYPGKVQSGVHALGFLGWEWHH